MVSKVSRMLPHLLPKFTYSLSPHGFSSQDRRHPTSRILSQGKDALDLIQHVVCSRMIHLIHHDNIRYLHHTGLQGLDESPEPGIRLKIMVSATVVISTSLCPTPTVSKKITSFPAASNTRDAWSVVSATPPRWPLVPMERMKTSGSKK